jgi:hypothetical protein
MPARRMAQARVAVASSWSESGSCRGPRSGPCRITRAIEARASHSRPVGHPCWPMVLAEAVNWFVATLVEAVNRRAASRVAAQRNSASPAGWYPGPASPGASARARAFCPRPIGCCFKRRGKTRTAHLNQPGRPVNHYPASTAESTIIQHLQVLMSILKTTSTQVLLAVQRLQYMMFSAMQQTTMRDTIITKGLPICKFTIAPSRESWTVPRTVTLGEVPKTSSRPRSVGQLEPPQVGGRIARLRRDSVNRLTHDFGLNVTARIPLSLLSYSAAQRHKTRTAQFKQRMLM